jgi:hypothetical protein
MQLAAAHQAPALFQVRSGCVFGRPIGQKWTRSRMDPLLLPVVVDVIEGPAPGEKLRRLRRRRYLRGGTNGRSVKAASLSVADLQAAQSGPGMWRSQAARLARKCPSALFPSLAASAMLSKKTGERSSGADLPAQ